MLADRVFIGFQVMTVGKSSTSIMQTPRLLIVFASHLTPVQYSIYACSLYIYVYKACCTYKCCVSIFVHIEDIFILITQLGFKVLEFLGLQGLGSKYMDTSKIDRNETASRRIHTGIHKTCLEFCRLLPMCVFFGCCYKPVCCFNANRKAANSNTNSKGLHLKRHHMTKTRGMSCCA